MRSYPIFAICLLALLLIRPAVLSAQMTLPPDWQQGCYYAGNHFQSPPDGNCSVFHNGDTVLCGLTYAKLCRATSWPGGSLCAYKHYVRRVGTRVLAWNGCSNPELVYYDFGLQVNDTISLDGAACYRGRFEVDSVYPVTLLDGSVRTYLRLHGDQNGNAGDTLQWIDEIGDIRWGYVPNCDFEGGASNLICHKENGIKRYINVSNSGLADCDSLTPVARTEPVGTAGLATLAPNPVTSQLRVQMAAESAVTLSIYDMAGGLHASHTLPGSCIVPMTGLVPGLYHYILVDAQRNVQQGRFLKL